MASVSRGCELHRGGACTCQQYAVAEERVTVASQGVDGCMSNGGDGLDGAAVVFQPETAAGQDLLVAALMQVGETARELDLITVHRDRAPGALAGGQDARGDIVHVHGKEPP